MARAFPEDNRQFTRFQVNGIRKSGVNSGTVNLFMTDFPAGEALRPFAAKKRATGKCRQNQHFSHDLYLLKMMEISCPIHIKKTNNRVIINNFFTGIVVYIYEQGKMKGTELCTQPFYSLR
jgi:hypothetical protein